MHTASLPAQPPIGDLPGDALRRRPRGRPEWCGRPCGYGSPDTAFPAQSAGRAAAAAIPGSLSSWYAKSDAPALFFVGIWTGRRPAPPSHRQQTARAVHIGSKRPYCQTARSATYRRFLRGARRTRIRTRRVLQLAPDGDPDKVNRSCLRSPTASGSGRPRGSGAAPSWCAEGGSILVDPGIDGSAGSSLRCPRTGDPCRASSSNIRRSRSATPRSSSRTWHPAPRRHTPRRPDPSPRPTPPRAGGRLRGGTLSPFPGWSSALADANSHQSRWASRERQPGCRRRQGARPFGAGPRPG